MLKYIKLNQIPTKVDHIIDYVFKLEEIHRTTVSPSVSIQSVKWKLNSIFI